MTFAQASAKSYDGQDYNLVCFFDCLHDMGDPVGAARHAYQALGIRLTRDSWKTAIVT